MAEQTQAQEQAEGQNQQSPMPSDDQTTSEPTQDVEAASDNSREVSDTSDSEDLSLPDDTSSRTAEQFEKLRSQLREEKERRERLEQVYNSSQPQSDTAKEDDTPLYDPNTGYVDVNKLEEMRKVTREAQKNATEAQKQFRQYVQQQQEREAFEAHPELNPDAGNKHDKELFNMTRAILTDSQLNPNDYGGKELSARQAADLAKKQRNKVLENAKKEGAQQAVEQLSPKEQASLEATGRSDRRGDVANRDELVQRTRRNDLEAISQRLKNIQPVAGS